MRSVLQIPAFVALAVGMLMLYRALSGYAELLEFYRDHELTKGIVKSVNTPDSISYYPVVQFRSLDNQILQIKSREPASQFRAGDTVSIYYDLVHPDDMYLSIHRTLMPVWIYTIAGLCLSTPAIGILLWLYLRRRKAARIMAEGKMVQAQVIRIEKLYEAKALGISAYKLVCEWHNPNIAGTKPLVFESNAIWQDPSPFYEGKSVEVYYQPEQPERYHIALALLPPDAIL